HDSHKSIHAQPTRRAQMTMAAHKPRQHTKRARYTADRTAMAEAKDGPSFTNVPAISVNPTVTSPRRVNAPLIAPAAAARMQRTTGSMGGTSVLTAPRTHRA